MLFIVEFAIPVFNTKFHVPALEIYTGVTIFIVGPFPVLAPGAITLDHALTFVEVPDDVDGIDIIFDPPLNV